LANINLVTYPPPMG